MDKVSFINIFSHKLDTKGQPPKFELTEVIGTEELAYLFLYDVYISAKQKITVRDFLHTSITISINYDTEQQKKVKRYIHGVVTQISESEPNNDVNEYCHSYKIRIEPKLALLDTNQDYRIFHNKSDQTDLSIVKTILEEGGIASDEVEFHIQSNPPVRPYRVQYEESIFHFFQRLLQKNGWFYYFKHEFGKHILVVADQIQDHAESLEGQEHLATSHGNSNKNNETHIFSLEDETNSFLSEYTVINDDYETYPPKHHRLNVEKGLPEMKITQFPSEFATTKEGSTFAELYAERESSIKYCIKGTSLFKGISIAKKFKLSSSSRKELDGNEFIIKLTNIVITQHELQTTFVAFPKELPFRPKWNLIHPKILGHQCATVVGTASKHANKEADPDPHGSVFVYFHWDLYQNWKDAKTSCYVRVASMLAGKTHGSVFTPKPGTEVLVSFLNGDPDYPVIVGCLHGGAHKPGFNVQDKHWRSMIKTHEDTDANQILFDDPTGKECLTIHTKKDHHVTVQNQEIHHVQSNRQTFIQQGSPEIDESIIDHTIVDGNRKILVKQDSSLEEHVNEGDFSHHVEKNYTIQVNKDFSLTVAGKKLIIQATDPDSQVLISGGEVIIESTKGNTSIQSASELNLKSAKDCTLISEKDFASKAKNIVQKSDESIQAQSQKVSVKGSSEVLIKGGKTGIN